MTDFWTAEGEDNAILRKVLNCLPFDAVSYSGKKELRIYNAVTVLEFTLEIISTREQRKENERSRNQRGKLSKIIYTAV